MCRAVIEPSADVSGAPLLTAFQDQRANLAGAALLIFQPAMNIRLTLIQIKRLNLARFGPDKKALPRIMSEVVL